MNTKRARILLTCRRPGGGDDDHADTKEALALAKNDPSLKELFTGQTALDGRVAAALQTDLAPAEKEAAELAEYAQRLDAHWDHRRLAMGSPAMIAVGVAFLFLIAVLVWHFLGRAGAFPDEAVKIALTGMKGGPELFLAVEEKTGNLPDWFVLKGFDHFKVPPGLESFPAVGVRIFKVENHPVAMAAVPGSHRMFFFSFESAPFDISVVPEKKWLITESEGHVLAIRQDGEICFLIAFRGKKPEMERLLAETKSP